MNPLLYTFEGQVSSYLPDPIGAATGVTSTTAITYRIVIDQGVGAFTIDNSNNMISLPDNVAVPPTFPANCDFFYADYYDGALMDEVNGGCYNAPSDTKEFNICADGEPGTEGQIFVLSNDHTLYLYHPTLMVKNWVIGTTLFSSEIAHGSGTPCNGANNTTTVSCALLELTAIGAVP